MFQTYYRLAKPGIVYGNCLTTLAGYFFGSAMHVQIRTLLATLLGTATIIGGACVINNLTDRSIDSAMNRTKNRATVTGRVRMRDASIYASILIVIGFSVLLIFVNVLTATVGLVGLLGYTVLYGYTKRRTVHGTLLGSIAGSMPIVAGYTAATNHVNHVVLILFCMMASWQMPHFYAIGLYRLADYKAAGLPVWPVRYGVRSTKRWMLVYLALYCVSVISLYVFGHADSIYVLVMSGICLTWIYVAMHGYSTVQHMKWARSMFGFSLITLLAMSGAISIGSRLP